MRIPLMKNAFLREKETKQALSEFILNTNQFSMGQECEKFEHKFSRYQRRTYSLLFNSGGSANLALLQALKSLGRLKDGDKIGFSSLTWSTNVMPIIQMGFIPVPIDCEINTINVMSKNLIQRIKEVKLSAFFATNVLGYSGDLDIIKTLCADNDILFLEDNCESLGAEMPTDKVGNFSLASTFSFYVAHHMSTIEGGMLCTDDDELYQVLKMTRANGWDRNLTETQQTKLREPYNISPFNSKYSFFELGFNLRPTEITGFLGQHQMQYLEENIAIRNNNHRRFETVISQNDDLLLVKHDHMHQISPFGLVVLCKTPELREKYLTRFIAAEIEVRPVIAGNMQNQPFYSKYVEVMYDLPNTDFIHNNGFYCGNYPELSDADIDVICNCLKK
ncbi:MAG: DegT/DnrJ/EryC1/StrS family aminotransferase [Paludibacteraceae bacterium]|nr:DegT/DnrJ/EryC1/StrS family aminotransferase [Paludibacteraceae bacterium]